jgi:hypothetical protein
MFHAHAAQILGGVVVLPVLLELLRDQVRHSELVVQLLHLLGQLLCLFLSLEKKQQLKIVLRISIWIPIRIPLSSSKNSK